jgi:carboxypeptidase family protein
MGTSPTHPAFGGMTSGIPDKTVQPRDQSMPPKILKKENGSPFVTTTLADGSFVFDCVPHGFVEVWTTADPTQMPHTKTIGPEGWTNVKIVIQATCGNLAGKVTDAATGAPIAGATVTEAGGRQTTTDTNGCFTFVCLPPAGDDDLTVEAPGYQTNVVTAPVPTAGNFDCQSLPPNPINIPLQKSFITEIQIRLDWGAQPSDLDSHLSGPDPAGGRVVHVSGDNPTIPRAQPVAVAFRGALADDVPPTLGSCCAPYEGRCRWPTA